MVQISLRVGLPHGVDPGPPPIRDRPALRVVDVLMGVVATVGPPRRVRKRLVLTVQGMVVLRSLFRFKSIRTIRERDPLNITVMLIPRHQNGRPTNTGISGRENPLLSPQMIKLVRTLSPMILLFHHWPKCLRLCPVAPRAEVTGAPILRPPPILDRPAL